MPDNSTLPTMTELYLYTPQGLITP
jgi:hypothetical protein